MTYNEINWEDFPSTATPKSAANFNHMDAGIKANDLNIADLQADKVNISDIGVTVQPYNADTVVDSDYSTFKSDTQNDLAQAQTDITNNTTAIGTNTVNININAANININAETLIALAQAGNIPVATTQLLPIRMSAGLMDFSITNADNLIWYFPDRTTSTLSKPSVTLASDGIVYAVCDDWSKATIEVEDNNSNSLYVGTISDLSNLTHYLSLGGCTNITGDLSDVSGLIYFLNLDNCTNITGDLSDVSGLTNYLSLSNCTNITGDLSDVSGLTNYLILGGCTNITGDLSDVSGLTKYLILSNCTNITGILQPTATLSYINLSNTGLSINDVDQSVINLDNVTTVSGTLNISGLQRSSASTSAINSLIAKGWSITDATVV